MKQLWIVFGFVAMFGALTAQTRELTNAPAVIEEVNAKAGWYAIVPDGDRGTRYAPDRLSDAFKKNGLRVIVSGRVGRVDPNVRSWGIPLMVTKIAVAPSR